MNNVYFQGIFMKKGLVAGFLGLVSVVAWASGMGISAQEAYEKVAAEDPGVLFVDVRDPVEIMFVGFTDVVHANIPYLLVDRSQWDEERGVFRLYQNPDFAQQIKQELARRGMSADAEVITLCRSGSERGKPSAEYLRDNGLPNARYVINGFQGSPVKEGEHAGQRIQNGWQNSGLPWSAKMTPSKMYRVDVKSQP